MHRAQIRCRRPRDMSPIHRKTPKGIAEFEARSHGLSARMRSALILVDGQRSDADILRLLGPQAEALLVELTWQNFIERVSVTDRPERFRSEHPQGPGAARPDSPRGRKKPWSGPAFS